MDENNAVSHLKKIKKLKITQNTHVTILYLDHDLLRQRGSDDLNTND